MRTHLSIAVAICALFASTAEGQLECRIEQVRLPGPASPGVLKASCNQDETVTGGSCFFQTAKGGGFGDASGTAIGSRPTGNLDGWGCEHGFFPQTSDVLLFAVCCKVNLQLVPDSDFLTE